LVLIEEGLILRAANVASVGESVVFPVGAQSKSGGLIKPVQPDALLEDGEGCQEALYAGEVDMRYSSITLTNTKD